MNHTTEILFDTLRTALFGQALPDGLFDELTAEQWTELYRLAARQGVLAICYDVVSALPKEQQPPRNLNIQWALGVERIEHRYDAQRKAAQTLSDCFAEHGIKTYVLKGLGISSYYPVKEYRECGDIDCYLGEGFEQGNQLAMSLGAKFQHQDYRHYVLRFQTILVENHHYFVAFRGNRIKKKFEQELHETIESNSRYYNTNIFIPAPLFSALFLTSHAFQHFLYENITVRHIIDWALLVKTNADKVDWERFNQICDEQGFSKFVGVVNSIVRKYFGQDCLYPGALFYDDYCDKVLESILYLDNRISNKGMNAIQSRVAKVRNMHTYSWKYKYISDSNWFVEAIRSIKGIIFEPNPKI